MTASKEYKEGRTAVRNPVASEKGPQPEVDSREGPWIAVVRYSLVGLICEGGEELRTKYILILSYKNFYLLACNIIYVSFNIK